MDKELRASHLKARKSGFKEDWDAYHILHGYYCPPPRCTELGKSFQTCKEDRRMSPAWGYKTGQWCNDSSCPHWYIEVVCKDCKQVIEVTELG